MTISKRRYNSVLGKVGKAGRTPEFFTIAEKKAFDKRYIEVMKEIEPPYKPKFRHMAYYDFKELL